VTNALVKIIFSYAGYENAFKRRQRGEEPGALHSELGRLSLLLVAILYILANVAYFSAVPKEELVKGSQVVASLFFQKVFGSAKAARALTS